MNYLNQWQKILSIIYYSVAVGAILIGGIFTLVEYLEYKSDKKQSASSKLVSAYSSKEDLLKHRKKLDLAWRAGSRDRLEAASQGQRKASRKTPGWLAQYNSDEYVRYIIFLIKKKKLGGSITYVMDFYEGVATCVITELCDENIIDASFLKPVQKFFENYYPYICLLKIEQNDNSLWLNTEEYFLGDRRVPCHEFPSLFKLR